VRSKLVKNVWVGMVSMDLGSIPPQSVDSESVGIHGGHGSHIWSALSSKLARQFFGSLIRIWVPQPWRLRVPPLKGAPGRPKVAPENQVYR
jgi:hypothetical protein